ncbi:hypothetical protein [Chroococcidiopsis sp. CCMEE 29]|uniref:hypothetical protein n=1 Tax=Chroococcidiopsis sp. CCMEE 29 TaxID=155894 RepID=UPI0020205160|nr:hypothetical protein [Chroococcidiopsis sp. CCMEE 29]
MSLTPEEKEEMDKLYAQLPKQMPPGMTLESIVADEKNWGSQRISHRYDERMDATKAKGMRGVVARYLKLKAKAEGGADA